MTIWVIWQTFIRHWYVFVVTIASAVLLAQVLQTGHRVFVAETEYAMSAPETSLGFELPPDTQTSLIAFAGVVATRYNAEYPTAQLSSPSASMVGNGIRDGVSVELAKSGSQWGYGFGSAVIKVRVTGASGEVIKARLTEIGNRLERITAELQKEDTSNARHLITATNDPDRVIIGSFGPSRTAVAKSTAVLVLVGMVAGILVSNLWDLWSSRQGRQPHWSRKLTP